MRKHLLRALPTLISLVLFFIAILIIHQILKTHPLSQIVQEVKDISGYRLAGALGLTALSFLLLSVYDLMALSYIGVSLPYRSVARASFIGYAFSNIVGHSLFSGGAVRYRFYSKSGTVGYRHQQNYYFLRSDILARIFHDGGNSFPRGTPHGRRSQ